MHKYVSKEVVLMYLCEFFQTESFRKYFSVSITSSLNILAVYMQVPYKEMRVLRNA